MSATRPQNALLGLLGWRLVRLIETHSEQLARGLLARIQDANRTSAVERIRSLVSTRVGVGFHYIGVGSSADRLILSRCSRIC